MKRIASLLTAILVSVTLLATTYTVAGGSTALFGSTWDNTDTNNDMELADGLYTLTKSNVILSAGNIEFKVVADHEWTVSYPESGNYNLPIGEQGEYNVTITFDESTHEINATAAKIGEAVVIPTVQIKGNWDEWAEYIEFTQEGDGLTATAHLALAEVGSYEFKVVVDGSWLSNGYAFTRDDNSATDITSNLSENMQLTADVAGDYTFTWTYSTNSLTITFPASGTSGNTQEDTFYTVIGDYPLLSIHWDITSQEELMTQQEGGNYTYTIESIGLVAGQEYNYKFIANNSWDVDTYPRDDSNYTITVDQTALYTITFSLTPGSGGSATPTKIGDPEISIYTIMGDSALVGAEWGSGYAANDMTYTDEGWQLTKQAVYLPAGTYNYEVAGNHDPRQYMYPITWQEYTIEQAGTYDLTFTLTNPIEAPSLSLAANPIVIDSTGTDRLYCRVTQEWWTTDDAAVAAYLYRDADTHNAEWPGARMNAVGGQDGLWYIDLDASVYTNVIFTRVNGSGEITDWGAKTADLPIPTDGKNLYTITSTEAVWGDPGVEGTWSTYQYTPTETDTTIYSLVGMENLFGVAWDVSDTTTEMTLDASIGTWSYTVGSVLLNAYQKYEYKVVANHSWETAYPTEGNYSLHVSQSGYYSLSFAFNTTAGAVATPTLLEATGNEYTGEYSNYALLINHERMIPMVFAGDPDVGFGKYLSGGKQYLAHAHIHAGDTVRMLDRARSNAEWMGTLEEGGESANFSPYSNTATYNGSNNYLVCQTEGCYDVYYKNDASGISTGTMYVGSGTGDCTAGITYDGSQLATATINLSTTYGGYAAIDGEYASSTSTATVTCVLGATVYLQVFPSDAYQFLKWEDGSLDTLRSIVVTGDMSFEAQFGKEIEYMYGVLVNSKTFFRSTESSSGQHTVRAQLYAGDTVQLMFTGYYGGDQRRIFMYNIEPYGMYEQFTGGADVGYLVCQEAGCYDIYIKEGETNSVYIGQGTVCRAGEDVNSITLDYLPGFYLYGSDSIFGSWDSNKAVYLGYSDATFSLPAGLHQIHIYKRSYGTEGTTISSSCSASELFTINNYKAFYMQQPGNLYISSLNTENNTACVNGDFNWVYSLAGDSALFGKTWDIADLSTEMIWIGDNACNYSLDSVVLQAGEYNYKVVSNHTWDATSYPSDGNFTVRIDSAGVYQILFDFIPGTGCTASTFYIHAISNEPTECIVASGTCGAQGDNVTWRITCDSIMFISGTGAMANYSTNQSNQAPWAAYGSQISNIVIEEGVTSISAYGFYNAGSYTNGAYNNVHSLSIPSSVSKISNNNFYQCPLHYVSINSDSIVGKASYSSGSSLHKIFGAQVREYYIGNDVKSIANNAFYNQSADSVQQITLPEGLTSIGTWAFGYLEHMTTIIIPNTVETIGSDAFAGCSALQTVVLGSGLTQIEAQAFWKDSLITYVTCEAVNPPSLGVQAFDVFNTLYVHCDSKQLYKDATNWKNFRKIRCIEGGDEYEEVEYDLTHDWTFIMLPTAFGMQASDLLVEGEIEWGTYNGETRASGRSGWEESSASAAVTSSQAIIVRAKGSTARLTVSVPAEAQAMRAVSVPLSLHPSSFSQNANWCFVGNPYPYGYVLSGLSAQGIEAPIHIWNGIGYDTYTPGIDDYIIPAFGAFFIQLPEPAEGEQPVTAIQFTADWIYM